MNFWKQFLDLFRPLKALELDNQSFLDQQATLVKRHDKVGRGILNIRFDGDEAMLPEDLWQT